MTIQTFEKKKWKDNAVYFIEKIASHFRFLDFPKYKKSAPFPFEILG